MVTLSFIFFITAIAGCIFANAETKLKRVKRGEPSMEPPRIPGIDLSSDEACQDASGVCNLNTVTCIGGSYRKGMCGGPANRRCCVPFSDNDDQCTAKAGNCQLTNQGCEGGDFWVGLCAGVLNRRCCIPNAGCDPNENDFRNIPAADNFDEDLLMGTWYEARWYMPLSFPLSFVKWDWANTYFKKDGQSNTLHIKSASRNPDKGKCNAEIEHSMTSIRKGVYNVGDDITLSGRVLGTFVYIDQHLAVEVMCYVPTDNGCKDFAAIFWSRCKSLRPQDIAKGVNILEDLCYPEMERFIDVQQEKDCAPPMPRPNICECDNKDDKDKEKTCDKEMDDEPERNCDGVNLANVMPDHDFTLEKLMGTWFLIRWYLPMSAHLSHYHWDSTGVFSTKKDHPDMIFSQLVHREKGKMYCEETKSGNSTIVSRGKLIRWFAPNALATTVYMSDSIMVEVHCIERSDDGCEDIGAYIWVRSRNPDPKDVAKGVNILRNICFPNMDRFVVIKQEMDCLPPKHDPCNCGHKTGRKCEKRCDDHDEDDDRHYGRDKREE